MSADELAIAHERLADARSRADGWKRRCEESERDLRIAMERIGELLKAMVRLTREVPYPEEHGNVATLIAEVGTQRAVVRELLEIPNRIAAWLERRDGQTQHEHLLAFEIRNGEWR